MSGGVEMFAKTKVSRKEIIVSVLLGTSAALISLFILWNGIATVNGDKKLLPVSNTPTETSVFYATQHGAFSSLEAAAAFQKQHPTLNKSIIYSDGPTFYLWSSLFATKTTLQTTPTSFSKKLTLDSNACTDASIASVPKLLIDEKALKNNFEGDTLPADWQQNITAISALTTDVAEIRLLLLDHYVQQHECLNIKFD